VRPFTAGSPTHTSERIISLAVNRDSSVTVNKIFSHTEGGLYIRLSLFQCESPGIVNIFSAIFFRWNCDRNTGLM